MNKEKIAKKLNEYVKSINECFEVTNDGDLNLKIGDDYVVIIDDWDIENVLICQLELGTVKKALESDIIGKFYTKAVELINEMNEINNDENIKHRKLLAIRALEDVLLGGLKVKEYRECAGEVTLKLEKASEEK